MLTGECGNTPVLYSGRLQPQPDMEEVSTELLRLGLETYAAQRPTTVDPSKTGTDSEATTVDPSKTGTEAGRAADTPAVHTHSSSDSPASSSESSLTWGSTNAG